MTNSTDFTEWIVRCRVAGIAMLLSTAVTVGASAQQETNGSAGQRSTGTPCPPMQVNGSASSSSAGASGSASYGTPATTSTSGATTAAPSTGAPTTGAPTAAAGAPTAAT